MYNNSAAIAIAEYPFAFVWPIKMKIISNIYFIRTKKTTGQKEEEEKSEQLMQMEEKQQRLSRKKNNVDCGNNKKNDFVFSPCTVPGPSYMGYNNNKKNVGKIFIEETHTSFTD